MIRLFSYAVIVWGILVTAIPWVFMDNVATRVILTLIGLTLLGSGLYMLSLSDRR